MSQFPRIDINHHFKRSYKKLADYQSHTYAEMKRSSPYWQIEIPELKREALVFRRKYSRYQRKRTIFDPINEIELQEAYKVAKHYLQKKIKQKKRQCWRQLFKYLDDNQWSDAYQIVKKLCRRKGKWKVEEAEISTVTQSEVLRSNRTTLRGEGTRARQNLSRGNKYICTIGAQKSCRTYGCVNANRNIPTNVKEG